MAKKKYPRPWFRGHDGWWYVQMGKRQVKLAQGEENEEEAWRRYHAIMSEEGCPVRPDTLPRPTVTRVCNLFLDWSKKHHTPATYEWYRHFLESFQGHAGGLRVGEPGRGEEVLEVRHVTTWLGQNPTWQGGKRSAVVAVKRCFNWAYKEGHVKVEPLRGLPKPPARARDRVLDKGERRKIAESYPAEDPFRDFLFALEQTGCRPGEVAGVTAAEVNLRDGTWVFEQ